jgi:hypothetical protein
VRKSTRYVLALAIAVRMLFLWYNVQLHLPPGWPWPARMGIIYAQSSAGVPLAEVAFGGMEVDEAAHGFRLGDRGVAFPHFLAIWLFGNSSFLHLQVLQLAIDALMVLPVASIGRVIGGGAAGTIAALAYAVFVPQLRLAGVPSYDTWVTFGFVTCTWAVLRVWGLPSSRARNTLGWFVAVGLALLVTAQFRSAIVLYLACMAFLVAVAGAATRRLPVRHLRPSLLVMVSGLLLASAIALAGNTAANVLLNGTTSPVRSTFGHAWWTGIGQFPNPYGVTNNDRSIVEFYEGATGRMDQDNTMGVAYNAWLLQRGIEFVREYPALFASMVVRRALWVALPTLPLGVIADEFSFASTAPPVQAAENQALTSYRQSYGHFAGRVRYSIEQDRAWLLARIIALALRVLLPLGLIGVVALSEDRVAGIVAAAPVLYIILVFSAFYGPGNLLISAWAAALPAVVTGLSLAGASLRQRSQPDSPGVG